MQANVFNRAPAVGVLAKATARNHHDSFEALAIKGCLVRIDAIGCQKDDAGMIHSHCSHYLLAVKNNPPGLRSEVEDAFVDMPMDGFEHTKRDHWRTVLQHAQVIANTEQVDTGVWTDCMRIGRVDSLRQDTAHPKVSLKGRRKMAGWDDDERMRLLGIKPLC